MKAQVKKTIASHLVRAMPVAGAPPHDAPNLLADIGRRTNMRSKKSCRISKIRIEKLILKNTPLNGLKTPFFSDRTWGQNR